MRSLMARVTTVPELQALQQTLLDDQRRLEGQQKTLVYENYGQFIQCQRKIRDLHGVVEGNVGLLEALLATVRQYRYDSSNA